MLPRAVAEEAVRVQPEPFLSPPRARKRPLPISRERKRQSSAKRVLDRPDEGDGDFWLRRLLTLEPLRAGGRARHESQPYRAPVSWRARVRSSGYTTSWFGHSGDRRIMQSREGPNRRGRDPSGRDDEVYGS